MKTQLLILAATLLGLVGLAEAPQREGTKTLLSPSEVADLKKWVDNAQQDLKLLRDDVRKGNLERRRKAIIREFEVIVRRSAQRENELLMRYTLNRALEIDDLVGQDPAPSELQSLVGFLDSTIDLSQSFYTDDQKYLEAIGRGDTPQLLTSMAVFAYQYTEMLLQFSRTFLRPSLEYQITFKALGWMANDLNSARNLQRLQFAETITRIARLQSRHQEVPSDNDNGLLESIRQFKWEYRERVLQHVVEVNNEIAAAAAKIEIARLEAERLALLSEAERKQAIAEREREEQRKREWEELLKRGVSFDPEKVLVTRATVRYRGQTYSVTGRFRNGNVSIKMVNYPHSAVNEVSPLELAASRSGICSISNPKYCVDTFVYYKGDHAKITGVYMNGQLATQMVNYPHTTYYQVDVSKAGLAASGTCSRKDSRYCVGKNGVYSGKPVTIRGVYPDGDTVVQMVHYPHTVYSEVDPDSIAVN